ncbi:ABC transporter permease [Anianabacter salinae]|uniref:ABC transporter permease n=1 Tax=Anianabacter salinae TaxID=2851023 RepID=UPI00225DCEED|nr:ABC transporter permease [Anianabacter salinae]MBV0913571.1 ABC transporter permease [Anianabacter salinae]
MFEPRVKERSTLESSFRTLELIYHATVRSLRKSHGNAVIGLVMSVLMTCVLVGVFYVMFTVLGGRGMAIRGNFILFLMSGIFVFMVHNAAVQAVMGAEGPTSAMMLHGPMNPAIAICAAAISSLYTQTLSIIVILFAAHVLLEPIVIEQPVYAFGMVMLGWASGCAIGLVFLALKPFMPSVVAIVSQIYRRMNMIFSGKMFVANSLPAYMLHFFTWNPLFHAIDQGRGFIFINYTPHNTNLTYPITLTCILFALGMMGEFYARKNASASMGARG